MPGSDKFFASFLTVHNDVSVPCCLVKTDEIFFSPIKAVEYTIG